LKNLCPAERDKRSLSRTAVSELSPPTYLSQSIRLTTWDASQQTGTKKAAKTPLFFFRS
jgi:hypothetical protein